jgi:hypothetical protein
VDHVIRTVTQRPECKWVSLTTSSIVYGSYVVESILNASLPSASPLVLDDEDRDHDRKAKNAKPVATGPDILLAPLDSKYYAHQGVCALFNN